MSGIFSKFALTKSWNMKKCDKCGAANEDSFKFCIHCGAPLPATNADVQEPTNTSQYDLQPQQPVQQQMPQNQPYSVPPFPAPGQRPAQSARRKKNNNTALLITLGAFGVVLVIAIIAVILIIKPFGNKHEAVAIAEDSDYIEDVEEVVATADIPDIDTPEVIVETATPASASRDFTASGNIDGYPFSLSGTLDENGNMSGSYHNDYNGTKLRFTGYEAEGVLEITLSSNAGVFYLDDQCDGHNFDGRFVNGSYEKPAHLYIH